MNRRRLATAVAVLGGLVAAIVALAATGHWRVAFIPYVVLLGWLPFHIWRIDRMRKDAYREGAIDAAERAARAARPRIVTRELPDEPLDLG